MNTRPLLLGGIAFVLVTAAATVRAEKELGASDWHNRRERMAQERLEQLPAAEQALAREMGPLRDSLHRAIGEYSRKVGDGAQPRSLTTERTRIRDLKARLDRLEASDPETFLDLLGHMPPPPPGGPRGHHPGMDRPGPEEDMACPRHQHPPKD